MKIIKLFIAFFLVANFATAQTEATAADYAALKVKTDSLHHAARYGNNMAAMNAAEQEKFNNETIKLYGPKMGKQIIAGEVQKGFSSAAVERALGVADATATNGKKQIWTYKNLRTKYVLTNNKVTDIWDF